MKLIRSQYPKYTYSFERESWKEYFYIRVSMYLLSKDPDAIPKYYYAGFEDLFTDTKYYFFGPLVYPVRLFFWVHDEYYFLARQCKYRGWIKKEEGARYSRLWPLQLFKNIWK